MEKSNSLELILGEKLTKEIYNKLGAYIYSKINRENATAIAKELKENGLDLEILKRNGEILVNGKAGEIKEIIKVLEEEGIGKEILKRNATILAKGKAREIKDNNRLQDTEPSYLEQAKRNLDAMSNNVRPTENKRATYTDDLINLINEDLMK